MSFWTLKCSNLLPGVDEDTFLQANLVIFLGIRVYGRNQSFPSTFEDHATQSLREPATNHRALGGNSKISVLNETLPLDRT